MMKRRIKMTMACMAMTLSAMAQTMNIQTGNVTTAVPAAQAGDMTYSDNGRRLTVCGKTFDVSDITKIYVDESPVTDNEVVVSYDGAAATVVVAGNVAQYLDVSVSGAHVSIVQGTGVGDETGEIAYSLSGSSADGEFTLEGKYKATLNLNGLTLTNPSGAAVNIQDGKRIKVSVKQNTTNTLTDGANGDWKGAFVCKGHTEFKGKGTLNVYGKTAHGIWSKEYVEVKNCTINVLSAVKDGFNINQYFLMESGTVTVSGVGDDGIQVSYKTDDDGNIIADEENTGEINITGGTLNITVTAAGAKGLKAEGGININENSATVTLTVKNSGGVDTSDASDLKSSACIKSDKSIAISGGTLTLTNTGQGGRAMNCEGTIDLAGGILTARAEGSNYGNSSSGGGGGGGWPGGGGWGGGFGPGGGGGRTSSGNSKNAKCIKAKGNMAISGGTISTYSASHEGIEAKGTLSMTGGTVSIQASDDAINSGGDMTISGGTLYAWSTGNDGVDANGNMYLKGGVIIGFGAGGAEAGIDVAENKKMYFTGGQIFGIGGRVDGSPTSTTGAQAYGYTTQNVSCSNGGYLVLSQGNTRLFAVKAPSAYSGIVLCSSPDMASGTSYSVGSATAVTGTVVNGFVNAPTVSSVSNARSFTARK